MTRNNQHSKTDILWKHQLFIKKYKEHYGCRVCGSMNNLVFHHIEPERKTMNPPSMAGSSIGAILREIEKCHILCASCHSQVHTIINKRAVTSHSELLIKYIYKYYGICTENNSIEADKLRKCQYQKEYHASHPEKSRQGSYRYWLKNRDRLNFGRRKQYNKAKNLDRRIKLV